MYFDDWEMIGAIAGLVSAAVSVLSLFSYGLIKARGVNAIRVEKIFAFSGASAAWAALVWVGTVLLELFGPFMVDEDYLRMFAFMFSFPALIAFFYFVDWMQSGSTGSAEAARDEH